MKAVEISKVFMVVGQDYVTVHLDQRRAALKSLTGLNKKIDFIVDNLVVLN